MPSPPNSEVFGGFAIPEPLLAPGGSTDFDTLAANAVVAASPRPDPILLDQLDPRSRPLRSTLGKRIARIVVFASLARPAPALAADAPLGVVMQANLAHVKQSNLTKGATVYSGEELSTDDGGSLDLEIASSRIGLAAGSRAHFYSGANGVVADLTDGTLTFRRNGGADGIEVVASDVRIVPKGGGPATGQVTFLSPCKITISSVAGEIAVTAGKESRIVKEGEVYSVLPKTGILAVKSYISPEDPAYHDSHTHQTCALAGSPRDPAQFRKIGLLAAAGGAGALIGLKFLTSHPGMESPDKP